MLWRESTMAALHLTRRFKFSILFVVALLLLAQFWFWPPPSSPGSKWRSRFKSLASPRKLQNLTAHPIDVLIEKAEHDFQALLAKRTNSLAEAAAQYRARRGRHPPPGFDAWHKFATEKNALMVEDFFDAIYDDLNPFWALEPRQIRTEASSFEYVIKVRGHSASANHLERPWMELWLSLVKTIENYLPDLDMAINVMDEPRLVVPWEKINEYMEKEKGSRKLSEVSETISEFSRLEDESQGGDAAAAIAWDTTSRYFDIARRGCPPDSLARHAETVTDYSREAKVSLRHALPHMYRGYISNWTLATSLCHQPDLQALHGSFIEPLSIKSSDHLLPMFGGSKLAVNNEILLPPAMYWSDDKRYSGAGFDRYGWEAKQDRIIWRGAATGGRNKIDSWQAYQRHRFVSMVNATKVARAEDWLEVPRSFELPPQSYQLHAAQRGRLGEWVGTWGDAAFYDLICWPAEPAGRCRYTGAHFDVVAPLPMAEQFQRKYLPDIDGNSFSGRYRGFLRSNSLPVKATIFREWHDARLVPWKHFVPMDNRFVDIYGIMEYFVGYRDDDDAVGGHDDVAKAMAFAGQAWAEQVLRREDMQIYVFRLLLEYARVADDKRQRLGYVADLRPR